MDEVPFVITSLFFICATMSIVFYLAWRTFGWPRHALTWCICFAVAATQWAFNVAHSFDVFSNYFLYWAPVNILGPTVNVLAVTGYRQRAGKYLNIPLLVGIVMLSFGATMWFSAFQVHRGMGLAILPLVTVLTSLWTVWIVYDVPRPKRSIEWTLIVVYFITAMIELIIGLIALSMGAEYDTEIVNLFRSILFLFLPVAFSITGVLALATIASDLAVQSLETAEHEVKRQKKETEQSWHTLFDAIEAIPDLVAIDDGKGNVVTCNTAFANLLGVPQDQLPGRRTLELMELYWRQVDTIDGDRVTSSQDFANRMWRSLTTGERLQVVTRDKRNFIVDCGYVQGGGLILVGRDVTQLADTRIRLEAAIHSAPIAFAFFDKDQKLVACNKSYEKMLNKRQEWLLTQPIDAIIRAFIRRVKIAGEEPLVVRSSWLNKYLDAIEARETVNEVAQMEDGTWYEITSQPVAEGGYVTVATDITTRHVLEKDLERNEAQLRQILEGQPFPVIVMRKQDQRVMFASAAAVEALTGKTGVQKQQEVRAGLNTRSDIIAPINEAANVQPGLIQEVSLKRFDGESFPALFSSQPIAYSGTDAAVVSFIDLSSLRHLESELEVQQQALFQSQKLNALGTLLAGVAHELNNPLTVVVANAHVLTMANDDPATKARVQKITDAAERCSNIVRSFLDMARKGSGDTVKFNITDCVSKSIEMAEFGYQDQEITVRTDLAEKLPAIEGDSDQIGQVVMNLIINAKHALQDQSGEKLIEVRCQLNAVGDKIELFVSDNGPGVPDEIRGQIFDPFFTTKRVGHGTGMGLSLVHGIVEAHGGQIDLLQSTEPGAHFRVTLPHTGDTLLDNPAMTVAGGSGKSYKILVVDDEPDVLEALEDILIIQGHDVVGVQSGQGALDALSKDSFHGILSDLRMPEMDGPQLYRNIKSDYPAMADRIAFVTGNNLSETAKEFLTSCNRPSLGKPFSPDQISALLREMGLK
jgi:nitrogen-specific signal transduction histidine kinase